MPSDDSRQKTIKIRLVNLKKKESYLILPFHKKKKRGKRNGPHLALPITQRWQTIQNIAICMIARPTKVLPAQFVQLSGTFPSLTLTDIATINIKYTVRSRGLTDYEHLQNDIYDCTLGYSYIHNHQKYPTLQAEYHALTAHNLPWTTKTYMAVKGSLEGDQWRKSIEEVTPSSSDKVQLFRNELNTFQKRCLIKYQFVRLKREPNLTNPRSNFLILLWQCRIEAK